MKTKILLSITMLAMVINSYAETRITVSLEKLQYAIDNPGTPLIVSTIKHIERSPDWLWETSYTTNRVIVYKNHKLSRLFDQNTQPSTSFCWMGLIFFIAGTISAFLSRYIKHLLATLCLGIAIMNWCWIFILNENIYWWLPILVLVVFVAVGKLGHCLNQRKNKKTKEEKL